MRHNHVVVGQASDQASGSVGQAGAGDPRRHIQSKSHEVFSANEFFGSVVITGTDTGSDHVRDRARKADADLRVEHRPAKPQRRRQIPRRNQHRASGVGSRSAPFCGLPGAGSAHGVSTTRSLTVGFPGSWWTEEDHAFRFEDEVELS